MEIAFCEKKLELKNVYKGDILSRLDNVEDP